MFCPPQTQSVPLRSIILVLLFCILVSGSTLASPQKRGKSRKRAAEAKPIDNLAKLREEYIRATKDYKASLEKLLAIHEKNVGPAEERFEHAKSLYAQGLISKNQLDESESGVVAAKKKVSEAQQQLSNADTQIANTLLEAEAEAAFAKARRLRKGAFVQTTSYLRFNGSAAWALSDSWKLQQFFYNSFKRPLPIAVFGQGAIHDRWRLDHRNSIDVSLHPDGVEGQALLSFLRANGIPFLAFRSAIPGTATGPHIHIGRPSHRY